jgi:hypothetical protein
MSNAIPPIMVQIAADVSQLKAGLAQAQSSIKGMDSTVATANTGMQNMIGSAKKMAATVGVAFAATQVVQFGKDVIMAASSMAESVSKVNVVFGENAASVLEFGEKSASALGIGSQKALEAAGTYGNLFQALGVGRPAATEMSTSLVQLAADLASFNNTSIDDALNALRSGLSGETEPLKRFGVALNEVTLKNKAMAMGFGEIKGVMDPAIKAQVTYALVMEQTSLAQGDYARTADGTANTMKSLAAEFENAKVAIGEILMPAFKAILAVLKLLVPVITAITKYFKDNADAIKMLAILVAAGTTAFLVYKGVMIATGIVTAVYTSIVKAQAAGFTVAQLAAFNLKVAIFLLNNAMRANPIGLIVTALALLAAGFVYAWKKSETFRGIVIKGVQMILDGFSKLVSGIGKFAGLISKVPGMGWAKGIADGAQNAADKIAITSKNLSDLKSNFKGMGNVSMTTGSAGVTGGATTSTTTTTTTNAADAKKKAEEIKKTLKDVAKVYKDMNKVIADSQEKVAEATKRRDEATADANKRYNESVAKSKKQYDESIESADKALLERTAKAYERNKEQLDNANKEYAKRTKDLEQKLQDSLTNLRAKAADKAADLTKKAADKQQDIIQKSVDRLRSAFASKTGFNIAEAFGGGKSTEALLSDLKAKLNAAKNLAENAAFLQANGFSQTFIEQVVSAGPAVGNSLAESILNSSPESIAELKATFNDMENTSNYGLDALAKSMNTGANLATQELRDAYNQVAIDLQTSIAEINEDLTKALAEANSDYSDAMAEAKTNRDERFAEAAKDLKDALAEADKDYKESVAEAKKTLAEALADAAKTLTETLADVQKTYNEALDRIAKDTQERIDDLKAKLKELAATLTELGAKQAAINAVKNAPVYTPVLPTPAPFTPSVNTNTIAGINAASGFNLTQNISYPTASATEISAQTLAAIKFGTSGGYTPSYKTVGSRDR